jgi:hypothetical protein
MPGLVGAVMRRGGFYASFRDSISHKNDNGAVGPEEGIIHLKLFNLVMKELGPRFLEKGVFIKSSDIIGFLADQWDDFLQGCREVLLNGEPVAPVLLKNHPLISKHLWTHLFLK